MKKVLLLIIASFAINLNAQIVDCTDLFFSEYVEGSSQNKALEVYNPTDASIDLSNYTIERYSNGATNSSAGGATNLTGMLASGDAFVITHGETDVSASTGYCDPLLISLGDMADGPYPSPLYMNGNDAIVLTKNGEIIDVFGKVGEDPGTAWSDSTGTWWTNDHTLIRKKTVLKGDNIGTDSFDPSLEWDSLAENTWINLGSHTCDCQNISAINESKNISYIIYPNPANVGESVIVSATERIKKIEVINILGKKVLITNSNSIVTDNLAKGNYIININFFDGRQLNNKLIIE